MYPHLEIQFIYQDHMSNQRRSVIFYFPINDTMRKSLPRAKRYATSLIEKIFDYDIVENISIYWNAPEISHIVQIVEKEPNKANTWKNSPWYEMTLKKD